MQTSGTIRMSVGNRNFFCRNKCNKQISKPRCGRFCYCCFVNYLLPLGLSLLTPLLILPSWILPWKQWNAQADRCATPLHSLPTSRRLYKKQKSGHVQSGSWHQLILSANVQCHLTELAFSCGRSVRSWASCLVPTDKPPWRSRCRRRHLLEM